MAICVAIGFAVLVHARQAGPADASVIFRIIVVSTVQKAQALREQVLGGGSFAALARTESIDPSAERGGLIGPVPLAELREELREILRTLDPVAVSSVITLPTGFAIVQREQQTSGSSGRCMEIALSLRCDDARNIYSQRIYGWHGFRWWRTAAYLFPYPLPFENNLGLYRNAWLDAKQPADRVIDELATLRAAHPSRRVAMTDRVMPHAYFRTLIPRLRSEVPGLDIFYEQKANLSLEKVLALLPALQRPTISSLSEGEWVAVNTIIEERTVRDLIPKLKAAGGQGIVEYPLNKIV